MKPRTIFSLLALCALVFPVTSRAAEEKKAPIDEVPEGARGFRGVVLGEVVEVEGSLLTVKVLRVGKTFEKSEAKNAESLVGKTFEVRGFRDDARDLLRELKAGDRVDMAAEAGRSGIEYPGEYFRRAEDGGHPKAEDGKKPEGKKEDGKKPEGAGKKAES